MIARTRLNVALYITLPVSLCMTVLPQILVRVLKEVSPTSGNVKQHNKTLRTLHTFSNSPPHCPTHGYSTACAPQWVWNNRKAYKKGCEATWYSSLWFCAITLFVFISWLTKLLQLFAHVEWTNCTHGKLKAVLRFMLLDCEVHHPALVSFLLS